MPSEWEPPQVEEHSDRSDRYDWVNFVGWTVFALSAMGVLAYLIGWYLSEHWYWNDLSKICRYMTENDGRLRCVVDFR